MLAIWMAIALSGHAFGQWKAGIARVDITPTEPVLQWGYAERNRPHLGIRQPLSVKALALEDAGGIRSVLLTYDLLGIPRELGKRIAERMDREHRIPRARLALNSSHTHSAPMLWYWPGVPQLPSTPGEVAMKRYTDRLIDQSVEAVAAALKNLQPAQLSYEFGYAGIAVNRRRVRDRSLPGPVDPDVLVLAVRGNEGGLRGVVFGYACHATVLNDYQVNGDWPGYAQEAIEAAHPGVTAMFVAGAGADQNPLPRRSVELAQAYGRVMRDAVNEILSARMKTLDGPLHAAFENVDLPLQPPSREELEAGTKATNPMVRAHADQTLQRLNKYGALPRTYSYPVQVWRFGSLTMIMLAGEVVVDYSIRLRTQHGWDSVWVAGYSNDVFAYVPSKRVRMEGGYEGKDAMINWAQPSPFAPEVEDVLIRKIDQMMAQLPSQ